MPPLPAQCPIPQDVIYIVASELRDREMHIPPALLTGDAGVLLDRLTERGLDKLASTSWMVEHGQPHQTWVRWIAWSEFHAGTQQLNRMSYGLTSIVLGDLLYLLGRWLMSGSADPMPLPLPALNVVGLPSGLWYSVLVCSGDTSVFYSTSAWASWRLYPMLDCLVP